MRLLPLLACALACFAPFATAADWHFDIIGDTPYSDYERRHLPGMLADISATKPAFIIHVGDIKSGTSWCSDAMYADRLVFFNDAAPTEMPAMRNSKSGWCSSTPSPRR